MADYYRTGTQSWPNVITVLPPGTRIRFAGTRLIYSQEIGRAGFAAGTVLTADGQRLGLVDLTGISADNPSQATIDIRPEMLQDAGDK